MSDRPDDSQGISEVRLDKWLWAARFFKTRALAAAAVSGGKISVNGQRAKPGRVLRPGDTLIVPRGACRCTVTVKSLSRLRGPAPQAEQLYDETEESKRERAAASAQMRLERPPEFDLPGRPSKKHRRDMERWTRRRG